MAPSRHGHSSRDAALVAAAGSPTASRIPGVDTKCPVEIWGLYDAVTTSCRAVAGRVTGHPDSDQKSLLGNDLHANGQVPVAAAARKKFKAGEPFARSGRITSANASKWEG